MLNSPEKGVTIPHIFAMVTLAVAGSAVVTLERGLKGSFRGLARLKQPEVHLNCARNRGALNVEAKFKG